MLVTLMELTPAEREIVVDLLVHGDNCSGNVHSNIGRSRSHTSTSMGSLKEKGLVRSKGAGVHTLTLEGVAAAREIYREP